ncbi:DUF3306 domain-containing protein [Marimonas lutisalis]|uniref:DUF3306 domain-containing protein n=1 Tax=Marimonas lutisalis TaxID=2545756 RepID=UPI0010F53BED|nr:DUF3306 domain-containing protein [Marimonas lutisalis]
MSDFWSRRKAAVAAEAQAEDMAQSEALREQQEAALEQRTDEELLQEAGFPEPEALETSEDVRAFLKASLPERLKTRALRRLWRMNPVLANVDGLVDYGEDFTDAATVVENLQTVYQVGKGMFVQLEELSPEVDQDVNDVAEPDEQPEVEDIYAPDVLEESEVNEETASVEAEPEPEPAPRTATGRRMRFEFET